MPKKGQLKGTPRRRAEFIEHLRTVGEGDDHIYWPWADTVDPGQYTRIYVNGQKIAAHRWVYGEVHGGITRHTSRGAIGDDLVLHTCDVKPCVRPSHLYRGDAQANSDDIFARHQKRLKVSDDDVRRIRALRAAGVTMPALAKAYDVTTAYINDIVHRKLRKTVE